MYLFVGTSGYSYAPWKGTFYPEKLPAAKMLAHYAGRLSTVEINNTFYRMPNAETVGRWAAEVPAGFRFALKSPRRITHEQRLVESDDALRFFFGAANALGEKMGPALFQLPPFLRKDLPRLETFLDALATTAPQAKATIEFRHPSWFADDVYDALRKRNVALCLSESEELATPTVATADWGYLRLRRQDYDDGALATWVDTLRAQSWKQAFVYFKHEDEGRGPVLAERLRTLIAPA